MISACSQLNIVENTQHSAISTCNELLAAIKRWLLSTYSPTLVCAPCAHSHAAVVALLVQHPPSFQQEQLLEQLMAGNARSAALTDQAISCSYTHVIPIWLHASVPCMHAAGAAPPRQRDAGGGVRPTQGWRPSSHLGTTSRPPAVI